MQKLFSHWNNIIVLGILIYVALVYFRIIRYPSERWSEKFNEIKNSKYNWLFTIGLLLAIIGILADMIF